MKRTNENPLKRDGNDRKRDRDANNTKHPTPQAGKEIKGSFSTPFPETSSWQALSNAINRYQSGEKSSFGAQASDHNWPDSSNKHTNPPFTGYPNYRELGIDIDYEPPSKMTRTDEVRSISSLNHQRLQIESHLQHNILDLNPFNERFNRPSLENLSHNQGLSPRTTAESFHSVLSGVQTTLQALDDQLKSYSNIPLPPDLQSFVTGSRTKLQDLKIDHLAKISELNNYIKQNSNNLDRPINNTDKAIATAINEYTNKYTEFSTLLLNKKHELDTALYKQTQNITDTAQDLALSIDLDAAFPLSFTDNSLISNAILPIQEGTALSPQDVLYPVKFSDGQGNYSVFHYRVKNGTPDKPYAFMDTNGDLYFSDNAFDSEYPTNKQYRLLTRGEDNTAQFSLPTHEEAAQYQDSQSNQRQENRVSDFSN